MQSAVFEALLLNTSHSSLPLQSIPAFLYGCAWKKDKTADLVYSALSTGFKGIDVAAQPKHYREDLAGEGVRRAISEGKCKREDLFIQTKFSPISAHDPNNIPYDPNASIPDQIKTSIAGSLRNMRHEQDEKSDSAYLDSVVMHSPMPTLSETKQAWQALESFVPGKIHNLGISNVTLPVLEALYKTASIKPVVVQNRFHRPTEYDIPLRKWCRGKGIVYQSFWTLSANQSILRHPSVVSLAKTCRVDEGAAMYCLVMGLSGIICLNGTQNHMQSDLEALEKIRVWAMENKYDWENTLKQFKDATGDNNPGPLPVEAALGKRPLGKDRYA